VDEFVTENSSSTKTKQIINNNDRALTIRSVTTTVMMATHAAGVEYYSAVAQTTTYRNIKLHSSKKAKRIINNKQSA